MALSMAMGGIQRVNVLITSDGSGQRRCNSLFGWVCGVEDAKVGVLFEERDAVTVGAGRFLVSFVCWILGGTVFCVVIVDCVLVDFSFTSEYDKERDEDEDEEEEEEHEEDDSEPEDDEEVLQLDEEESTEQSSSFPSY